MTAFDTGFFGDPDGSHGDNFKASEHLGQLVAFVQPARKEIETRYGDQEATVCSAIVAFDADGEGLVYDDATVFGNVSRDAYAGGKQKIVLGVIKQGEPKPGQNPPFILDPANESQKDDAAKWFNTNASVNSQGRILIG